MNRITFIVLLLLAGITQQAIGRDGYRIQLKFNGTTDTMVFLAHYYGKPLPTIYKTDSARIDKKGVAVLESKEKTLGGIYLLLLSDKKTYFEMLLNNGDDMAVTVDVSKLPDGVVYKNSPDNEHFLDYVRFLKGFSRDQQVLQEQYNAAKTAADSNAARDKINTSSKALTEFRHSYIKKNPNTLLAKIFGALDMPEVPEGKHYLPDGTEDSLWAGIYYKTHYWDGFDFKDDRLINTPIYDSKLEDYFKRFVVPYDDSVIVESDRLLAKVRGQQDLFKYTLFWLTRYAENSKIMGMDRVFVYLVENYYMKGDAYWLDNEALGKYYDRASKISPNLLGRVGPEIKMTGMDGKEHALSDVKAKYTLLIFWDPTCGHCIKEIPAIDSLYKAVLKKKDVKVYAVKTEGDDKVWKEFIDKNHLNDWLHVSDPDHTSNYRSMYDVYSTPVIYLLDEKKIIKGKRLDHTNIMDVINMTEKKDTATSKSKS